MMLGVPALDQFCSYSISLYLYIHYLDVCMLLKSVLGSKGLNTSLVYVGG